MVRYLTRLKTHIHFVHSDWLKPARFKGVRRMKKINLPKTSERVRGLTPVNDGIMYVCDYDEVFKITISDKVEIEILDDDPYEFLESLPYGLGLSEGEPILEFNGNSIFYKFDPTSDFVTVHCNVNEQKNSIEFRTLSGDWFVASFSLCGKYIVMAEPYDIELYEL